MIDLNAGDSTFVGRSRAACAVRAQVAAFAASDATVLLIGRTGTGKEVLARLIHQQSRRRDRPLVVVDCASLSESLADSELFGHVRGSFTGASVSREGLLAEADGGTLMLDEICSASPAVQARLLRVLESRELRPVGSNAPRDLDIRVIAAANRDLDVEVGAGRFREDLLFRLDVLRMQLPTLAERREDIPLLAEHLLARIQARAGVQACLSLDAAHELQERPWPGNVRQLRSALERAVALARGGTIEPRHLPPRFSASSSPSAAWAPVSLRGWQAAQERAFLVTSLERHGWNRTAAARELEISRQALHAKLRRLRIRPQVTCMALPDARTVELSESAVVHDA